MDINELVEQITDIVIGRLSSSEEGKQVPGEQKVQTPVSSSEGSPRVFRGVIVLTETRPHMEKFWEQMRECARHPVEWIVFSSSEVPLSVAKKNLQPLSAQYFDTLPPSWKNMVPGSDFLIVPVITMTLCSKVGSLIADDIPSMLILQFLIERKQIVVGAEEIHFLNRFSAQLPKPLVNVMNTHFEMIRSMGLMEVEMNNLEREVGGLLRRTGVFGKGNNVITKTDIEAAIEEGKTTLEFLRGTIVTPLARAFAEEKNIQIVFR
jgi:hypothetical protein